MTSHPAAPGTDPARSGARPLPGRSARVLYLAPDDLVAPFSFVEEEPVPIAPTAFDQVAVVETHVALSDVDKANQKEITPLTQREAKQLLAAAEGEPYEALFVLALTTGARVGELCAVRWADLDFASGVLRIERTRTTTKNGPAFGSPKGGKARSVHLTPLALAKLHHHRTAQNAQRLRMGSFWEDNDLIFPTRTGAPLRPPNLVHRHFKPLLDRAGLPRSTRFHDLRHTCATLLLSRGIDVVSVQRLLGHASAAMTLDVYGHLMPNAGAATAAAMEAALG